MADDVSAPLRDAGLAEVGVAVDVPQLIAGGPVERFLEASARPGWAMSSVTGRIPRPGNGSTSCVWGCGTTCPRSPTATAGPAEYKAAFVAGLLETPTSFDEGYRPFLDVIMQIADVDG